jgi:ketopantoate reductase
LVALNTNYENFEINLSINAKKKILEILKETDKIIIKLGLKVPQTPESRIKQTLSSNVHIMSMLEDFRNGKKIEINNQWDSIKNLSTALGIKLVHSNKLYDKVKRKILTI